jgi:hypothetical protein
MRQIRLRYIDEFPRTFSIVLSSCLFIAANLYDYIRYKQLIPGYDYSIGFGVPFEFVVAGGFVTEDHIVWSGIIGDAAAILLVAALSAWACKGAATKIFS